MHVYWLNLRGEVMRVPVDGGATERVASTKALPCWIGLDGELVYFSTLQGEIYRVKKSGGTPELVVPTSPSAQAIFLLPGDPYPTEFRIQAGTLQWSDGGGVYTCSASDCKNTQETLEQGDANIRPFSFAMDGKGKMYASEEDHSLVDDTSETLSYTLATYREKQWLGLSGPTAYYELLGAPEGVYALATTDFGPIGVVHWTSASITFLASGTSLSGAAHSLAMDEDFMYWANAAADEITPTKRTASVVRCKKTGCERPEVLAGGQLVPRGVAVAEGAVYWTTGDGKVMKLTLPEARGAKPAL
jgi:hypothetical protein